MANLGTLLKIAEPSGFWGSIIKAFESVTGHYVLAIIFLTVVIRLVWGIVETGSKYSQRVQANIQTKMQPELEKLKAKYQSQPQVLSQKQNELYRKYYGRGYYGSCAIMFVIMALNMVIFFTLFAGLNAMATYKTSSNYDNLKNHYANCLNVADEYLGDYSDSDKLILFADYENIEFRVSEDGTKIGIYHNDVLVDDSLVDYKKDFSSTKVVHNTETDTDEEVFVSANENILALINKLKPSDVEDEIEIDTDLYLSTAVQAISMKNVSSYYEANKDSFLWIENIWLADSPLVKSVPTYKTVASQLGKKNIGEGEEAIYNSFMLDISKTKNKTNGYFILPILCVLASMFSIYINSLYTKLRNKKKGVALPSQGFKWSTIIIPMILGIFALFYNSVFAIYMLTGQLVSALITPLQLLIVDKIIDSKKKKEDDKIVVEYSRKF